MTTSELRTITIKEIVTKNFQTASVFEKYSLDFCCRGGKTIDVACAEKGIESLPVLEELSQIELDNNSSSRSFTEMSPDILSNYIVATHHAYVTRMVPTLYAHTQKVAAVHGVHHPEVIEIAKHFETVAAELLQHMKKEEQMLFPYIKALYSAVQKMEPIIHLPFGSVQNPIRMMEADHRNAGDEMSEIRSLSNNFTPPQDGCTTYRITFQELQEFEQDLHHHVHLENNILFPAAIRLEQSMNSNN